MFSFFRYSLLLAAAASLTACQTTTAADEAQPVALLGEWRLEVAGGGITGVMSPVAAGTNMRLIFGPDSTYARYYNGQLQETATFQLRRIPGRAGGPDEQLLILKTFNTPNNQPLYYPYYVTRFTATELHFTTGGGCALNSEYTKVATLPQPKK